MCKRWSGGDHKDTSSVGERGTVSGVESGVESRPQWGTALRPFIKDFVCDPRASQVTLEVKNLPANAGDIRDVGSVPGSGRSPGEGNGNPLQCSCLENPMDRGVWWAMVYSFANSRTWLKWLSTHACLGSFVEWKLTEYLCYLHTHHHHQHCYYFSPNFSSHI